MDKGIDVIGDIHGHLPRLEALLEKLGYERRKGSWKHPERTALFIGDLIDRGPEQLGTVATVRSMVDAGDALCLMGNHEFNAIGFATTRDGGGHLRDRSEKNEYQHKAFLAETGLDTALHREMVSWFKTLPIYLGVGRFRFAHACWDPGNVAILGNGVSAYMDACRVHDYFTDGRAEYHAAEMVLKGPEAALPAGCSYSDNYGIERNRVRLAWWRREARTLRDMAVVEDVSMESLEGHPPPPEWIGRGNGYLTFIGHYWMRGDPAMVADDVVCVDFSVAKDGVLTAYRLEPGDERAAAGRFVWV